MKKLTVLLAATLLSGLAIAQPPLRMRGVNPENQLTAAQKTRTPARSHWLIQFGHNPSAAELTELENRGASLLSYVPDFAFSISIQGSVSVEGLDVQRIHQLQPAEKISAELPGELTVRAPAIVLVEFYPDVDPGDARAIAQDNGLSILENPYLLPNHLLVRGSPKQLLALADWDEVSYIFPASRDLIAGRPVYACPGALTSQGSVSQAIPLVGDGWDGPGLGAAKLTYAFDNVTAQLPPDAVQLEIARAFSEWANHAQVTFMPSNDLSANQNIAILFATGDHGDGYPFVGTTVLAHTFYPFPVDPEPIAGDMHFNDAQRWQIGSGIDLFSVALHEAGHALGLGHSDQPGDVMYPYYSMHTGLMPNDIAAVQELYAAPVTTSNPIPGPTPDPSPTSPLVLAVLDPPSSSTVSPIALSGTVSGGAGSVEVSWTTNSGASGVAQGSTNWTISAIPLSAGTNAITITAEDSLGNLVTSTATVSYRPGAPPPTDPNPPPAPNPPTGPDATPPSMTILFPSTTNYVTTASSLVISGIATDNVGVASVTWATSNGTSGAASGTTNWSTPAIPVYVGATTIVITAADAAGNTTWRSLTVTRN